MTYYFDCAGQQILLHIVVDEVADDVDSDDPGSPDEGQQLKRSLPEQGIQTVEHTEHWRRWRGIRNVTKLVTYSTYSRLTHKLLSV